MALRILLLTGWLLVPLGAWAYHQGPGQTQKKLDLAAAHLAAADAAVAEEDYDAAIAEYDDALKALPEGRTAEARKIRLAKAKAQMLAHKLPDAHADLKTLVDEIAADAGADPALLRDARATLANSQYYTTWLMRLEGLGQDEWEPEVEAARQTLKLLAADAEARGDAAAARKYREDLEATVRLARMDLGELQGLPLPKQCKGCRSCNGKRVSKTPKPKGQPAKGAGAAFPLDDTGH